MIWFSDSGILTSRPNSVGFADFPLRIICVAVSNKLTSLLGACGSFLNMRAFVCRITC